MKNELKPAVKGRPIDEYTRCAHYHSPVDVIAIKFKCCGEYYPCFECHEETADHKPEVWTRNEFNTKAVLCGACNNEMTIHEYLASTNRCPHCDAAFILIATNIIIYILKFK